MEISVIICTYRRATDMITVLDCLQQQTFKDFEVIVVDSSGEDAAVREAIAAYQADPAHRLSLRLIDSKKGLTLQRNVGLREAKGNILCWFDDDVTFGAELLERIVQIFAMPEHKNVGGINAYDPLNYPTAISARWRLYRLLGAVSTLDAGATDRLKRAVPLSFAKPFSGVKQVGWLGGFCLIFRREAIAGLWFDEHLYTYSAEDSDFSTRVGEKWRLLLCGDLHIEHHPSKQSRSSGATRMFEAGFGQGYRSGKWYADWRDGLLVIQYLAGTVIVDVLFWIARPSKEHLVQAIARARGMINGWKVSTALRKTLGRGF